MSNDLMLDVGQANELKLAFRRADFSNDDIKRLCEGDILAQFRQVLLGTNAIVDRQYLDYIKELAEAVVLQPKAEHLIDCDADPFNPWAKDGWTVEKHQKGGAFKWDKEAQKNALYLSQGQAGNSRIEGTTLRKELADLPVLNANVLDYLLAHPDLIPEEWKGKHVFFWGTVYRHRGGGLYVRYLYWFGGRWSWSNFWLGGGWRGFSPAALRASRTSDFNSVVF